MKLLYQKPTSEQPSDWFRNIAKLLLNQTSLVVNKQPHRLVEIEFYYHDRSHKDPFTHCHPEQLSHSQWYFHRQGKTYRSGTYKGVDITFGNRESFGGILIRSIETASGEIVEGPCLCVEYLLQQTGFSQVAELDDSIARREVWNNECPFLLQPQVKEERAIFSSARVGLSLKRAKSEPDMPQYLLLPYRYLNQPRQVRKGKVYLINALHLLGKTPEEIHQLTGSP